MASLSLPRVLQQRKTSLEIERENFEKCQQTAIIKAINKEESPLKQKHVRSAIIGTFEEKSAQTFWVVVLRLPLQEDRIIAWKFCHVLHKLLREGYPTTIQHSQRHRDELENLGKLWVHLKDSYGKLIRLYCTLLIAKLDFHRRNPRFPGNLAVTYSELEIIGENDNDNYFQMSVEMFDYMDTILDLQTAIFGSIDRSRSNSMTSSGQCRLSPLIPCIQDASKLYDFCVKLLFKLHLRLPPDTLSGHRERFLKQFKELKLFYQNSNALQYFRNLISVPSLPENPPNFLVQSELRTYVTPVVTIAPEEPEIELVQEGTLIDTASIESDSVDGSNHNGSVSPSPQFTQIIADRDHLISHLQHENENLRLGLQRLVGEHKKDVNDLQDQITAVETELATTESELVQERQLKEDLFHQAAATAHSQDSEQKVKEEKFTRLKEVYTKLREEHIQLIRQKADVEKKLLNTSKTIAELELIKINIQNKLSEVQQEHKRTHERIQQSTSDSSAKLLNMRREHDILIAENEERNATVERLTYEKSQLERDLDHAKAQQKQLDTQINDLNISITDLNSTVEQLRKEMSDKVREIMLECIREAHLLMTTAIDEVDNPALSAVTCSPDYFRTLTKTSIVALTAAKTVNQTQPAKLAITATRLAHALAVYVIQGRATSNTSPDIIFGEQMADMCKQLGSSVLAVLDDLRENRDVTENVTRANHELNAMSELAETLRGTLKENSVEQLADLVENELLTMDKNIEEAAKMIQDMLSKSRAADSGMKLEVNEKILDTCTKLMHAIRVLVKKSRLLQAEIVIQGKGTATEKEFYKRNHRWTDGLISAAKAVGTAAGFLLTAADNVVTSQGKLEQLIVAAQEIAASTAQLVVASRVKADRNSQNLLELSQASRGVSSATGEVVATVKNCSQLIDEAEEFDTTKLTLHTAKKLEMDTQIRVLELEKELENNRTKLLALRRHHYQLAGEAEGWDSNTVVQ